MFSAVVLDGWSFKSPFESEQILKIGPSTVILINHDYNLSTLMKEGFNLSWPDLFNKFFKFPKERNSKA